MKSQTSRLIVWSVMFLLTGVTTALGQNAPYQVGIQTKNAPPTSNKITIAVNLTAVDSLNGLTSFDFRIKYDTLAFLLDSVTPGEGVQACGWDQFSFEPETGGSIHITGVALAGADGPTCLSPVYGVGPLPMVLCSLYFSTGDTTCNRRNCVYSPLRWYWKSCDDNVLVGVDSSVTAISAAVLVSGYPGAQDIADSTTGYPTYLGAQAGCPEAGGVSLSRTVDFMNGAVDLICTDEIDARGDVNLNNWTYEVADMTMLRQYFLVGTSAFTINVAGSLAASDIDGDGRQAFVGDLVRGGLVVIGEIAAITECDTLPPPDAEGEANFLLTNNDLSVTTDVRLGGVWLMVNRNVIPGTLDSNFTFDWNYDGTVTRILVTGTNQLHPASIESGYLFELHPFQEIDNDFEIIDLEACDTTGRFVDAGLLVVTDVGEGQDGSLPAKFTLFQNRPNPFNPETHIEFVLPAASSPVFEVFDVMGRLVKRVPLGMLPSGQHEIIWKGDNDSGKPVASGVYLYRLTAGEYQATRKAVLLK